MPGFRALAEQRRVEKEGNQSSSLGSLLKGPSSPSRRMSRGVPPPRLSFCGSTRLAPAIDSPMSFVLSPRTPELQSLDSENEMKLPQRIPTMMSFDRGSNRDITKTLRGDNAVRNLYKERMLAAKHIEELNERVAKYEQQSARALQQAELYATQSAEAKGDVHSLRNELWLVRQQLCDRDVELSEVEVRCRKFYQHAMATAQLVEKVEDEGTRLAKLLGAVTGQMDACRSLLNAAQTDLLHTANRHVVLEKIKEAAELLLVSNDVRAAAVWDGLEADVPALAKEIQGHPIAALRKKSLQELTEPAERPSGLTVALRGYLQFPSSLDASLRKKQARSYRDSTKVAHVVAEAALLMRKAKRRTAQLIANIASEADRKIERRKQGYLKRIEALERAAMKREDGLMEEEDNVGLTDDMDLHESEVIQHLQAVTLMTSAQQNELVRLVSQSAFRDVISFITEDVAHKTRHITRKMHSHLSAMATALGVVYQRTTGNLALLVEECLDTASSMASDVKKYVMDLGERLYCFGVAFRDKEESVKGHWQSSASRPHAVAATQTVASDAPLFAKMQSAVSATLRKVKEMEVQHRSASAAVAAGRARAVDLHNMLHQAHPELLPPSAVPLVPSDVSVDLTELDSALESLEEAGATLPDTLGSQSLRDDPPLLLEGPLRDVELAVANLARMLSSEKGPLSPTAASLKGVFHAKSVVRGILGRIRTQSLKENVGGKPRARLATSKSMTEIRPPS